jgi:hypothetical protein
VAAIKLQVETGAMPGKAGFPITILALNSSRIETHVKPLFGRMPVSTITLADLERMQAHEAIQVVRRFLISLAGLVSRPSTLCCSIQGRPDCLIKLLPQIFQVPVIVNADKLFRTKKIFQHGEGFRRYLDEDGKE